MTKKLLILSLVGLLLPSLVFGAITWSETQPAGDVDKPWTSIASDDDGSNLIAGVDGGRIYLSTNGGTTWSETQPAGDVNKGWEGVASDDDGSNLIAGVYDGRVYIGSIPEEIPPVSLFSISAGDITSLWGFASGLFSDAKLLVLLAIGVPVAFYVIKRAIGLAPKGR